MVASKQTRLKLRKGFHRAPIRYYVLMNHQFNEEDKKIIAKGLVKATNPVKAMELIPQKPDKKNKWRVVQNSTVGLNGRFDLQILYYKGLEVAVYWKRQTSEVIPDPEDPVPEGVLENPDDVWVRLDLFSKSPRQLVSAAAEEIASLHRKIAQLELENKAQERLLEANSKTITSLQGKAQAAMPPAYKRQR